MKYRRIPRISPWAYLFHKDISVGLYENMGLYAVMGLYADTKLCYWKVSRKWEVHCWKPLCKQKQPMIVLKCTKKTRMCMTTYMYMVWPIVHNLWTPGMGPWACTMKLSDVRTNPGLMRGHGLIRGWAYPRDSTVMQSGDTISSKTCSFFSPWANIRILKVHEKVQVRAQ